MRLSASATLRRMEANSPWDYDRIDFCKKSNSGRYLAAVAVAASAILRSMEANTPTGSQLNAGPGEERGKEGGESGGVRFQPVLNCYCREMSGGMRK